MGELEALYRDLIHAHEAGCFEQSLLASPLRHEQVKRHPLGFSVVQLKSGTKSLRLHLWRGPEISQPGFEIHDHTFELESYVIDGRLRHRTYEAVPDPAGEFAVYDIRYEPDASVMTKTAHRARLQNKTDVLVETGKTYAVPAGRLHDAVLHDCSSATTLVLTRDHGGSPVTYGPANGAESLTAPREALSSDTLADLGLTGARAI